MRHSSEGINSYGLKNIDLHVTERCIAILAAALTGLQHGIIENIYSVAYLV